MIQQVIINIGVSGSGKTTWSTDYIFKHPNTIRINRDDLRKHFYGSLSGYYQYIYLNKRETYITNTEELLFIGAIQAGYDIIIDNTNLKPLYIRKWLDFVKAYNDLRGTNIEVKFKIFPENNQGLLKNRILIRDSNIFGDIKELAYINKQISSLPGIIKYVEDNYKTQIINE